MPGRFRQILKKIVQTKREMGKSMREASFALVEAKYSAGEFRHTVFDAVEKVHRPSLAAGWLSVSAGQGMHMVCAEILQAASQHTRGFCVPLQRISCIYVLASLQVTAHVSMIWAAWLSKHCLIGPDLACCKRQPTIRCQRLELCEWTQCGINLPSLACSGIFACEHVGWQDHIECTRDA